MEIGTIAQQRDQVLQCHAVRIVDMHCSRYVRAAQTVGFAFRFEYVRVNRVRIVEHDIIVESGIAAAGHLEDLRGAGGRNHCVRTGHGRNYVLENALNEPEGETRYAVGRCPLLGFFEDPQQVMRIIAVQWHPEGILLVPLDDLDVFNAVFRKSAIGIGDKFEK